jgi:hypothetical protein
MEPATAKSNRAAAKGDRVPTTSRATEPTAMKSAYPYEGLEFSAPERAFKLEQFHLSKNLGLRELTTEVGPPTRTAGSGVFYVVCNIGNQQELWLYFDPRTFESLLGADVVTSPSGERRNVFTAGQ